LTSKGHVKIELETFYHFFKCLMLYGFTLDLSILQCENPLLRINKGKGISVFILWKLYFILLIFSQMTVFRQQMV